MSHRFVQLFAGLAVSLGLGVAASASVAQSAPTQEKQCADGLATAYEELKAAEAAGLGGKVNWSKAAGLLAAAKVQYEFLHYPNCIIKVKRARTLLKTAESS